MANAKTTNAREEEYVRLDKILHDEMEDLIHQRFPPVYEFCLERPVFAIPRRRVSDNAFAKIHQDLLAITLHEQSPLHGSTKDKLYFVQRMFHHVLKLANRHVPHGKLRVGLAQRVWLEGIITRGVPFPMEVNHHADLMITDFSLGHPLGCIEVRDEEVEFKQAMTRMFHASALICATYERPEALSVMTDLKSWWFQRYFIADRSPERLVVKLKFSRDGVVDAKSLRAMVELLHGYVLLSRTK